MTERRRSAAYWVAAVMMFGIVGTAAPGHAAETASLGLVSSARNGSAVVAGQFAGSGCGGVPATLIGTPDDDVFVGTRHRDVIRARGGSDQVRGRGGNDLICGGHGADKLLGGGGADRLLGMGDEPVLDDGVVLFYRGDSLLGGRGRDHLAGGEGRGADTVSFAGSERPVEVRLGAGRAHGQGVDRISGVEQVVGSKKADRLVGWREDVRAGRLVVCMGNELHGLRLSSFGWGTRK